MIVACNQRERRIEKECRESRQKGNLENGEEIRKNKYPIGISDRKNKTKKNDREANKRTKGIYHIIN